MNKKILIDARLYGLENAGLGRYTMNLVDNLSELDKDNNYIILLRKKYFNRLKFPNNWKKIEADFNHYTFAEQFKLPFILYKEKPDLVHFPHFNVPVLYFGKFIVTIHDLLMHHFTGGEVTTLPKPLYLIRKLGYKIAFYKATKFSKNIITPSNVIKDEIIETYKIKRDKIIVTYEGVDKNIIKKEKNSKNVLNKYSIDKPYFFYTGNAYPHKNLELAIKAVSELNKKRTDKAYLVIAGSRGEFQLRLEEKIKTIGAIKDIKLIGYVSDDDLSILYSKSLAFVYPSLMEGFGLQGLEAISSGTLVLASRIPVFKEVYKDVAIYFNPKDESSLVKRMDFVKNLNSVKREDMVKSGQDFIKVYSWSKMARKTMEFYNE
ncbi:glycosyltransferase family 4 protein [Patescibacteria group bacterium]